MDVVIGGTHNGHHLKYQYCQYKEALHGISLWIDTVCKSPDCLKHVYSYCKCSNLFRRDKEKSHFMQNKKVKEVSDAEISDKFINFARIWANCARKHALQ